MAASVISFRSLFSGSRRKEAIPGPWTNQELAELYRISDLLGRAGMVVHSDSGLSDENEPWFVFFSPETGDVVAHFARIGGVYIAVATGQDRPLEGTCFRDLVQKIIDSQPLVYPQDRRQSDKVTNLYLHPVVVLTAFVATALLYSRKSVAAPEEEADGRRPMRPDGGPSGPAPVMSPTHGTTPLDAGIGGPSLATLSGFSATFSSGVALITSVLQGSDASPAMAMGHEGFDLLQATAPDARTGDEALRAEMADDGIIRVDAAVDALSGAPADQFPMSGTSTAASAVVLAVVQPAEQPDAFLPGAMNDTAPQAEIWDDDGRRDAAAATRPPAETAAPKDETPAAKADAPPPASDAPARAPADPASRTEAAEPAITINLGPEDKAAEVFRVMLGFDDNPEDKAASLLVDTEATEAPDLAAKEGPKRGGGSARTDSRDPDAKDGDRDTEAGATPDEDTAEADAPAPPGPVAPLTIDGLHNVQLGDGSQTIYFSGGHATVTGFVTGEDILLVDAALLAAPWEVSISPDTNTAVLTFADGANLTLQDLVLSAYAAGA